MPCHKCGKLTYHPCYHWATKQIFCIDCYPFVCSWCGTTQTNAIWHMARDVELCDRCDGKRAGRMFGEPGDGTLFTEER
jgi:hypothetical protein